MGVVQALEEHILRQGMMTTRLVDERNSILGITVPYAVEDPSVRSDPANAPMYASYSNPKSESRPRSSLPPHSRPAKARDAQGRASAQAGAAGRSSLDAGHRKALTAADVARRTGPEVSQQPEINPPLKTWGSTGKRQPSRPRQKA